MTTEDSISREKKAARKLLRFESLAELGNLNWDGSSKDGMLCMSTGFSTYPAFE